MNQYVIGDSVSSGVDVEKRIEGEFMKQLQKSDVNFDITEMMEESLDKCDFGGKDLIVARIEEEVLEDAD